jgi:hypothetical protein
VRRGRFLDAAAVGAGIVLGIVGGIAAAIVLAVAGLVVYDIATRDPSPESEVRKLLASEDLSDAVRVRECTYYDHDALIVSSYVCTLEIERPVSVRDNAGARFDLTGGTQSYCFHIPRATESYYADEDKDASFAGPRC